MNPPESTTSDGQPAHDPRVLVDWIPKHRRPPRQPAGSDLDGVVGRTDAGQARRLSTSGAVPSGAVPVMAPARRIGFPGLLALTISLGLPPVGCGGTQNRDRTDTGVAEVRGDVGDVPSGGACGPLVGEISSRVVDRNLIKQRSFRPS